MRPVIIGNTNSISVIKMAQISWALASLGYLPRYEKMRKMVCMITKSSRVISVNVV
jgi:hypothetical protein